MTIAQLNTECRDARRIADTLPKLNKDLTDVIRILEKAKVNEDVINQVREKFYPANDTLNTAQQALIQYYCLLDSIAQHTDIDWPPRCGTIPDRQS